MERRDEEGGGTDESEGEGEELKAINVGAPQVGGKKQRHYGIHLGSSASGMLMEKLLGVRSPTQAYHQGVRVVGTMNEVYSFLIHLCLALHSYGAPSHRVEYSMGLVAHHFGVLATFSALRTVIIVSFGGIEQGGTQTHTFDVDQGLDCEKLYLVEELCQGLAIGDISLTEGKQILAEIQQKPPRYNDVVKVLANGFAAAAITPLFFRSGWFGVGVSFLLGIITGLFLAIGERSPRFARVLELVCAVVAAFLARFVNDFIYPTCVPGVTLGAVVWLLPGLTLTVAMTELATKNLISGTVRFFYGLVITLELGMGIAIGSKLAFWEYRDDECEVLSSWFHLIWVPVFSISANILLASHPKHWPSMSAAATLSYAISFLTSRVLNVGVESSSALSAIGLGLFANFYYQYFKSPSIIVMLAGVLLLVPGSIGVRGVTAFVGEKDAVSAITFTFQTIVISLSITVGIFVANLVSAPQPVLMYKIILSE